MDNFKKKYNISPTDIFPNIDNFKDLSKLYKKKALKAHPDRCGNDKDFKILQEAYECMKYKFSLQNIKKKMESEKKYVEEKVILKDVIKGEEKEPVFIERKNPKNIEEKIKENRKEIKIEKTKYKDINKIFDYYKNKTSKAVIKIEDIKPIGYYDNDYYKIVSYNGVVVEKEESSDEERTEEDGKFSFDCKEIEKDLDEIKKFKPKKITREERKGDPEIKVNNEISRDELFENMLYSDIKNTLEKNRKRLLKSKKIDKVIIDKAINNEYDTNHISEKDLKDFDSYSKKLRYITNKPL